MGNDRLDNLVPERNLSYEGKLCIAKAGVYWHFKNSDKLLRQLLDYWTHELAEVLTANPEMLALKRISELISITEIIIGYELARYDVAIRQWALRDAGAARTLKKVNRVRLNCVRTAYSESGFKG